MSKSRSEPTKLTLKPSFRHLQQAMYVARAVGEGPYRERTGWRESWRAGPLFFLKHVWWSIKVRLTPRRKWIGERRGRWWDSSSFGPDE